MLSASFSDRKLEIIQWTLLFLPLIHLNFWMYFRVRWRHLYALPLTLQLYHYVVSILTFLELLSDLLRSWYLFWWWLRRGNNSNVQYAEFSDPGSFSLFVTTSKYTDTYVLLSLPHFIIWSHYLYCWNLERQPRKCSWGVVDMNEFKELGLRIVGQKVRVSYYKGRIELGIRSGEEIQIRKLPAWYHFHIWSLERVWWLFIWPKGHGLNKH